MFEETTDNGTGTTGRRINKRNVCGATVSNFAYDVESNISAGCGVDGAGCCDILVLELKSTAKFQFATRMNRPLALDRTRRVPGHLIKRDVSAFALMRGTNLLEGQYILHDASTMGTYHTDIRDQRMSASSRECREQESRRYSYEG